MFSAFKKLASKQEPSANCNSMAGVPMSGVLQKKFSKGVQYNSNIYLINKCLFVLLFFFLHHPYLRSFLIFSSENYNKR